MRNSYFSLRNLTKLLNYINFYKIVTRLNKIENQLDVFKQKNESKE